MILLIEGLAMCFLMLLVCVVEIADGPVGGVHFYEREVQDRAVELGLITRDRIKKNYAISGLCLFVPLLVLVPAIVYCINGARGFKELFSQMLIIMMIEGLFDRIFIDWIWVGKTKAWIIPGTEDLMPYVPRKTMIRKWVGTLILFPALAAAMAGLMSLM